MKKYSLILTCFFALFLVIQGCKKDSTKAVNNANVAGNWTGRYSFSGAPTNYVNGLSVVLGSTGTISLTDSVAAKVYTGTYTITGDSLITDVSNALITVNFRYKVTNNVTKMTGSWSNAGGGVGGLTYLNKN